MKPSGQFPRDSVGTGGRGGCHRGSGSDPAGPPVMALPSPKVGRCTRPIQRASECPVIAAGRAIVAEDVAVVPELLDDVFRMVAHDDQSSTLTPRTANKSVSALTTVHWLRVSAIAATWMSTCCMLR